MKVLLYSILIIFFSLTKSFGQNVKNVPQKDTNWCYAATTSAIFNYYGIKKSQEEIVCDLKKIDPNLIKEENCGVRLKSYPEGYYNVLFNNEHERWISYLKDNNFSNAKFIQFTKDNLINSIKDGPIIMLFDLNSSLTHAMIITNVFKIVSENKKINDKYLLYVLNPAAMCVGCIYLMVIDPNNNNRIISLNNNNFYALQTKVNGVFEPQKILAFGKNTKYNLPYNGLVDLPTININDVQSSLNQTSQTQSSNLPNYCNLASGKLNIEKDINMPDSTFRDLSELIKLQGLYNIVPEMMKVKEEKQILKGSNTKIKEKFEKTKNINIKQKN